MSLLHRLDLNIDLRQQRFDKAQGFVRHCFLRHSKKLAPSNNNWITNDVYLGHVMHLQKVYKNSPFELLKPWDFAELLTDFGNHMWERGLYQSGLESIKLAEGIYAANPGQDLIEQSNTLSVLGGISLELGISRRRQGLDYTLKGGALRQEHFDNLNLTGSAPSQDQVVLMANSWNDLACCMMEYGSFSQVDKVLEVSLRLKRDFAIKEEDAVFNYAENYKGLANAKAAVGEVDDAVRLSLKAATMIELDMGPGSAAAQSFRLHYAYNLYQAGRYEEALSEHERIRKARIRIFSEISPHTLNSYYACSVVYHALGNLEEEK